MEENLKKKLKINKIVVCVLILIVIILLISCGIKKSEESTGENNNLSNFGLITSGDDYMFYFKQDKGIIKVKDDKEYQITDGMAYSLNYKDEYVYYMSPSSGGSMLIKCTSQNGEEDTILAEINTSITKMYLEDNYLYYVTANPNTISKLNLADGSSEIVITRTVSDFAVQKDMIYFTDEAGYLYQISVNSENYGEIGDKVIAKKFQILDNYIYYYSEDNGSLMKMDLKGKSEKVVSDKLNCDIFNVTERTIYYLDKDNLAICSINLNGSSQKEIVKLSTENTKINIYKNILYYLDAKDGSYKTYRIKTNGKETDPVKY